MNMQNKKLNQKKTFETELSSNSQPISSIPTKMRTKSNEGVVTNPWYDYSKTPNSALFGIRNLGHFFRLLLFNKRDPSRFKYPLFAYFHCQNEYILLPEKGLF